MSAREDPVSTQARTPDSKILKQVRHEDALLAQRTTYFVSAHAFLLIGFVTIRMFVLSPWIPEFIEFAIVLLGLTFSYLAMTSGWRTIVALSFWRQCQVHGIEFDDSKLGDFYTKGRADFGAKGAIVPEGKGGPTENQGNPPTTPPQSDEPTGQSGPEDAHTPFDGRMDLSWPWRSVMVRSTNVMTAVLMPCILGAFWVALSFTIELWPIGYVSLVSAVLAVASLVFFYLTLRNRPRRAAFEQPKVQFP